MMACLQIGESSLDGAPAAALHDQINSIVDNCRAAPSLTVSKRKRNKSAGRLQLEQPNDHQEPRELIVDLRAGTRGKKCRVVSVPDAELVQRDKLARSNEDVDAEGQMRTTTVHCSMIRLKDPP